MQTIETVKRGEALITNGGVWHASVYGACADSEFETEGVALTLSRAEMSRYVSRARRTHASCQEQTVFLGKLAAPDLLPAAERLIQKSRHRLDSGRALEIQAEELLLSLLRRWPVSLARQQSAPETACLTRVQFIRALEYMARAGLSSFRIETLAGELGIPRHRFFDLFRSSTRRTPADCFRMLLVERAKVQLQDPCRQIKQVSYDLGFSTPSHLASTFRHFTGLTPEEFRAKTHRGNSQAASRDKPQPRASGSHRVRGGNGQTAGAARRPARRGDAADAGHRPTPPPCWSK